MCELAGKAGGSNCGVAPTPMQAVPVVAFATLHRCPPDQLTNAHRPSQPFGQRGRGDWGIRHVGQWGPTGQPKSGHATDHHLRVKNPTHTTMPSDLTVRMRYEGGGAGGPAPISRSYLDCQSTPLEDPAQATYTCRSMCRCQGGSSDSLPPSRLSMPRHVKLARG